MITAKEFRAHCLSFPGAAESPHFDRASFRASDKIFATLAADETSAMVKLDLDTHEALLQADPESFFSFGGWSKNGATGVQLAKVKKALCKELVAQAHANVTAKKKKKAASAKAPKRR